MIRSLLAALAAALFAACGHSVTSNTSESNQTQTVTNQQPIADYQIIKDSVTNVQVPYDTSQSYTLYVPHSSDSAGLPPTIILFADPHGAGRLPVDKYRKLADRFGIALAGSNNSRNGLDVNQCVSYINNITNDLHTRLHYDMANICLAGFSGGSKVALQAASNNANINNAVYAGATIPFQFSHSIQLLGFAGTSDMNYSDLLAFADQLPSGSGTLIEFPGKHEWPDATVYQKAFYWLTFRQAKDPKAPKITALVSAFEAMINKEVAAAKNTGNLLEACQRCDEASFILSSITQTTPYPKEATEISTKELYKKQLAQKNNILKSETNQKQILMQAFQNQDLPWWGGTISHLRASTLPSDKRLLGFISLGCYSYTSQLIARGEMAGADHFAAIYELADPDNTDQLYFHAIIAARQGDSGKAMKYMQKAVNNGFSDWGKADAEPALATVRGQGSFSRLQVPSSGRSSR